MKLKFFKILLIAILPVIMVMAQPFGKEWNVLNSPTDKTLKSLYFIDSTTGWAAGEAGIIIYTTNAGSSWSIQSSNVQTFIHEIFFLDQNLGWALTIKDSLPFGTTILKTTNGGNNWVTEDFPVVNALVYTILFFDSINGFVGGKGLSSSPGNIAYTLDGGNIWLSPSIDSNMVYNFPVYNFNFYNRQFGYACGGRIDLAGVIWRTTDYGMNWNAVGISPDEIFDIFVFDSLNAITLSGDPEGFFGIANIQTTDAGNSWQNDSLTLTGLSFTIDFRTANEGWSASVNKFLFTSNRGETWIEKDIQANSGIWDLQFIDARTGYAVGDSGIILKLNPLAVSVEQEFYNPNKFILFQNYPNPFNPSTKIKYKIPGRARNDNALVTLKVFDVLGNEIAILVNEEKQPGNYETVFDASGHSAGIYFYRLKAGSFVQTKKMVYLK